MSSRNPTSHYSPLCNNFKADPGSTAIRQQFPMSGHSLEFNFALVILDNRVTPSFFIAFLLCLLTHAKTQCASFHCHYSHSTEPNLLLFRQFHNDKDIFTTIKILIRIFIVFI